MTITTRKITSIRSIRDLEAQKSQHRPGIPSANTQGADYRRRVRPTRPKLYGVVRLRPFLAYHSAVNVFMRHVLNINMGQFLIRNFLSDPPRQFCHYPPRVSHVITVLVR